MAVLLSATPWHLLRCMLYVRGKCKLSYPTLQELRVLSILEQEAHGKVCSS